MSEKTRYSDEELQEFKELILAKLDKAYKDYILYAIQAKQVIFESEYAESVLYEMI